MEVIPVGSSITDAQDRMQASGFECVFQWHGSWGGENNLNYLYCNRQDGGWMVQRVWQVAVMMQGVTVGDVRVATGLMGP